MRRQKAIGRDLVSIELIGFVWFPFGLVEFWFSWGGNSWITITPGIGVKLGILRYLKNYDRLSYLSGHFFTGFEGQKAF